MSDDKASGTCFVVMGYGRKTDFETGRTLDLDLTYRYIIKPAVEAAGLKCLRADEIVHSGPIDVPMYEQLLRADIVIADLSTSNKNAYYELGVRHALRPFTTIVICEDGIKTFPFDVNHVLIRQYHHMGDGIDYGEVERFRKDLIDLIVKLKSEKPPQRDSPVYAFLTALTPPAFADVVRAVAAAAAGSSPAAARLSAGSPAAAPSGTGEATKLYSELMAEVDQAQMAGDFETAKSLLKLLRKRLKPARPQPADTPGAAPAPEVAEDPYIIQRLALVTYKAKYATEAEEIAALREACALLWELGPATSNDTETLGLWGAVHKRLWDKTRDAVALDKAVRSYERGFYLRNDYYNGINFAYLLNVRSAHAMATASATTDMAHATALRAGAIADFVQARRVREEVAPICDQWLASTPAPGETASQEARLQYTKNKYWAIATKAEAYLGSGRAAEADAMYADIYSFAPEPWMVASTQEQRSKLEALLADSPLAFVQP